MAKDDSQLSAAKRAYWSAREVGNRREEARWANVVGDILKNRGQYVGALKWLRIDYDISSKFLPEKDLLPTCQSIGELFLRLEDFENALYYQKEHLRLAKEANDLVEQQRASTQLGRTYHEMLLKNENDHLAIQNAKKYFKSAMDLAQTLKENPPSSKSSFLKEYIDAYNNIGLLEVELEHFEQAEKVLLRGLEICDEEEVHEDDDGRSRLHHNLGVVYTRLRMWDKAREHIRKDILICKRIGHCQGEAKGYINLGELHWQVQKYEDAMLSYQKALELAKSMQDEDALVTLIKQNMEVVDEYVRIMAEMKKEEQNLKKLKRNTAMARGMSSERKCLQQQITSLDHLLDKSSSISAWLKHLEFAKMKKRIATELCDKEKLSDSFLAIGESYKRLRKFRKGLKWLTKSWETYKLIGNLEGQALAKINIGDALDCSGDWMGALKSFEEGYRTAVQANLPLVQVSALENMHYSHMMRFDNIDEARRLQVKINELKQLIDSETKENSAEEDCCPETESEDSSGQSNASELPENGDEPFTTHRRPFSSIEEVEDDEPLISLFHPVKRLHKQNTDWAARARPIPRTTEVSLNGLSRSTSSPLTTVGRKRTHLVLSDDEDEVDYSRWRRNSDLLEDVATSNDLKTGGNQLGLASQYLDVLPDACKCTTSSCTPVNLEESACSYKSSIPEGAADKDPESSGISKCCIGMKIEDSLIFVEAGSCIVGDEFDIEMLKVQVACSYYLQLPSEMKSNGLLPIIGHLKHRGQALAPREAVETLVSNSEGDAWVEVSISGWVQKRLIKLYVDCCKKLSEIPNMKLLKKLYNLEVSEDEVIVSDCELQDISVIPLLDALDAHKTIAMLDLSHNKLGNGTMEKLQKVFTLSGQKYGGLVLDLHNNLFGPTALFQICECPVLFSRLEVLNISGNRLTDSCGSYLSTILENCKALYSLNMERCSVTSRTIQKVTDALGSGSVLSQLSIGYNNPVSGSSLSDLLSKLATLERFSELSLNGLKLNRPTLDSICQLSKSSCLSSLMLGATNIDSVGALKLTESLFCDAQELVKLDLSHCRLSPEYFNRLNTDALASCILELNLAGNPIMPKGGCALVSALVNPQCSIKVLTLRKCHLGLVGVIQIINALAENNSLEELNVAENIEPLEYCTCQLDSAPGRSSDATGCPREEAEAGKHEPSGVEVAFDQLQAADSYDNEMRAEPSLSALDDSCTSAGGRHALSTSNQSVMELVSAINKAKQLQLLDLSNNGFPVQVAGALYEAWSSSSRAGLPGKHIKDQTLHLSILGKRCCGVKPCCLRD